MSIVFATHFPDPRKRFRGREADAERLAAQLDRDYPQYTLVQRYWLPSIRAALALARKDWNEALTALEAAIPLELGGEEPFSNALMIPPYLRGLACQEGRQWEAAALEFEKLTSRPHLVRNYPAFPLARTALAKAIQREESTARQQSRSARRSTEMFAVTGTDVLFPRVATFAPGSSPRTWLRALAEEPFVPVRDAFRRDRIDSGAERVAPGARIDHREAHQTKVVKGDLH